MNEPIAQDVVLRQKITNACHIVESALAISKAPCILSSFGKDSMLMLFMVREWFSKDIPVIFFRQHYFPRKFAFGDDQAANLELELHANIPPVGISVTSKNGKAELVQHFQIGKRQLMMPLGRQSIEGRAKWLCGKETFLQGPFGSSDWPWDMAFCGHKSADSDPVQGDVPLQCEIHQIPGSCSLAFPLKDFTDEDVWRLTKTYDIPVNKLRYGNDVENPVDDHEGHFNEDYFPYCNKCLDPNEPAFVECPKNKLRITNISSSLVQTDPKLAYCGG